MSKFSTDFFTIVLETLKPREKMIVFIYDLAKIERGPKEGSSEKTENEDKIIFLIKRKLLIILKHLIFFRAVKSGPHVAMGGVPRVP